MVDLSRVKVTLFGSNVEQLVVPAGELHEVKVAWGRKSIFDPPRKRTCTISIVPKNSAKQIFTKYVTRSVKVEIPVIDSGGLETVFMGSISDIDLKPISGGKFIMSISAAEALTWRPRLQLTAKPGGIFTSFYVSAAKTAYGGTAPEVIRGNRARARVVGHRSAATCTVQQGFEVAVADQALAWASWSPDMTKVCGTIASKIVGTSTVVLSPRQIGGKHMTASIGADTHVANVKIQCDGTIGTAKTDVIIVDAVSRINGKRVSLSKKYHTDATFSIDEAIGLINAQLTDPRKLVISTDIDKRLQTSKLMGCWEQPGFTIKLPGEHVAFMLGAAPVFHPIGGVLRVKGGAITHEMMVCWT